MDAEDWHRQAVRPATVWPVALTGSEYRQSTSTHRSRYLRSLAAAFHQMVLSCPSTEKVAATMSQVVNANRLQPPGAMQMIALTAPFSAGKSTLVKHWGHQLYRDIIGAAATTDRPTWTPAPGVTADWRPVVYVTLMASSSIKEVNAQILLYLGYPPEGLARTTTTRVLVALKVHDVQLVIIDDAHMLRSTNATGRAVLDYVKFLNTELGERHATIALVGAHLEHTTLLQDPQIRGRLRTLTLRPLLIETDQQRHAWQQLLASTETRLLPYLPDAPAGIFSRTHPAHIWRRTQGYLGDTTRLLVATVLTAIADQRPRITHEDLDAIALSERATDAEHELTSRPPRRSRAS